MIRFLLAAFFISTASVATAECYGENILNTLPVAEREKLDALTLATPFPEGNLWRATKGDSVVHIVGTIHIYTPGMDDLVASVIPLVKDADGVFFEALEEDEAKMQQMVLSDPEIGFIVEGPTLPQLLSKSEWELLSAEMKTRGIPGFLAAKMKPWQIALTLAVPPCAMKEVKEKNGVDSQLRRAASHAGTPMFALDDVTELLKILTGGSLEKQIEELRIGLEMMSNSTPMFVSAIDTYVSERHRLAWEFSKHMAIRNSDRDAEEIEKIFADMETELLVGRNLKWMEILLPAISDGSYVVAVGAAHLSGEQGILKLLADDGYFLTPVVH